MRNKITLPSYLIPHFRSNHAGETGAVYIYRAIKMFNNDKKILIFAKFEKSKKSTEIRIIFIFKILTR